MDSRHVFNSVCQEMSFVKEIGMMVLFLGTSCGNLRAHQFNSSGVATALLYLTLKFQR